MATPFARVADDAIISAVGEILLGRFFVGAPRFFPADPRRRVDAAP
jgi:hypothetical protein